MSHSNEIPHCCFTSKKETDDKNHDTKIAIAWSLKGDDGFFITLDALSNEFARFPFRLINSE